MTVTDHAIFFPIRCLKVYGLTSQKRLHTEKIAVEGSSVVPYAVPGCTHDNVKVSEPVFDGTMAN
jgi:hypothetical protein